VIVTDEIVDLFLNTLGTTGRKIESGTTQPDSADLLRGLSQVSWPDLSRTQHSHFHIDFLLDQLNYGWKMAMGLKLRLKFIIYS